MFSYRSPYDEARRKGLEKMVDDVLYRLFFALSAIISSMFSFAQFIMFSTSGRKERARGVRLYSILKEEVKQLIRNIAFVSEQLAIQMFSKNLEHIRVLVADICTSK